MEPNQLHELAHNAPLNLSDWPLVSDDDYDYRCRTCGEPARRNPVDVREWGCVKCGYRTHSVSIWFSETEKVDA
jgi:hypothetical protein